MNRLPTVSHWALIVSFQLGQGSCRTLDSTATVDHSEVHGNGNGNGNEMLSEEQWVELCEKALAEESKAKGKDARTELHEISQTTDCQKAYPAVKKIYTDAYKVIVK
jgi:hypothetical protein